MKPLEISSAANAQYKIWQSLLTSKGIKEHQQFFLMGSKLVEEFIKSPTPGFKIEYILFFEDCQLRSEAKRTILTKDLFKELDVLGTHAPLLVLSFEDFENKDFNQLPQGLEIVCPLGDPRNLGALIRSAVGFQAREIILTQESTHPFLPQAVKASAGASLRMKFSRMKGRVSELPLVGENFALELHGTNLAQIIWPQNLRLWIGEEGPGLQLVPEQKKKMILIHIPTHGIESLNATTSAALAIWEWKKSN